MKGLAIRVSSRVPGDVNLEAWCDLIAGASATCIGSAGGGKSASFGDAVDIEPQRLYSTGIVFRLCRRVEHFPLVQHSVRRRISLGWVQGMQGMRSLVAGSRCGCDISPERFAIAGAPCLGCVHFWGRHTLPQVCSQNLPVGGPLGAPGGCVTLRSAHTSCLEQIDKESMLKYTIALRQRQPIEPGKSPGPGFILS